jgi:tRNA A-37 threonylcarbamoyl transferase component Bud32
MFVKRLRNVNHRLEEVELQRLVSRNYDFAPKIHKLEFVDNDCLVYMDDVGKCLADIYGDAPDKIPMYIWSEIHEIVRILYEEEGIEYEDITPYNFTEKDGKIYIIDFGHARYALKDTINWFLREFLDGENSWNPDYK